MQVALLLRCAARRHLRRFETKISCADDKLYIPVPVERMPPSPVPTPTNKEKKKKKKSKVTPQTPPKTDPVTAKTVNHLFQILLACHFNELTINIGGGACASPYGRLAAYVQRRRCGCLIVMSTTKVDLGRKAMLEMRRYSRLYSHLCTRPFDQDTAEDEDTKRIEEQQVTSKCTLM